MKNRQNCVKMNEKKWMAKNEWQKMNDNKIEKSYEIIQNNSRKKWWKFGKNGKKLGEKWQNKLNWNQELFKLNKEIAKNREKIAAEIAENRERKNGRRIPKNWRKKWGHEKWNWLKNGKKLRKISRNNQKQFN